MYDAELLITIVKVENNIDENGNLERLASSPDSDKNEKNFTFRREFGKKENGTAQFNVMSSFEATKLANTRNRTKKRFPRKIIALSRLNSKWGSKMKNN